MAIRATAPAAYEAARDSASELRLRLDIEAEDVLVEPEVHLGQRFADAREDDALSRHARRPSASQFALADHVHARAELGQRRQHRLVRDWPSMA